MSKTKETEQNTFLKSLKKYVHAELKEFNIIDRQDTEKIVNHVVNNVYSEINDDLNSIKETINSQSADTKTAVDTYNNGLEQIDRKFIWVERSQIVWNFAFMLLCVVVLVLSLLIVR